MNDKNDADQLAKTFDSRREVKQLEAGTVLNGRYEIVRRLGYGKMSAVYLATDRNSSGALRAVREVVVTDRDPGHHEKTIADFNREILLLTSLVHPSIPIIYDSFYAEQQGRFYLVMEYVVGDDLESRMRSAPGGKIDERTVTEWAIQIADVLEYLHTRPKQILLRDLRPANLMIDGKTGRVKLIDFGISRLVRQEEKGVTAAGTMGYAPPELFKGKVEPRSDIYSLGATLFHLLTGLDPQDNPLLIFDFKNTPLPRQIAPSISSEMEQILMRSVEYEPESRFGSAEAMRDALAIHREKLMTGHVTFGTGESPAAGAMAHDYCVFCGGNIGTDGSFCRHCGARQPLAGAGANLKARPTAELTVVGTTEMDACFGLLKDSNLLGRKDPHSNVFPEIDLSRFDPEAKVSRRHARIWRQGETFCVEDLGSVNGTLINGVRLAPRQPRVLESRDKIQLGKTTLYFLLGGDRRPEEPPIYLDENVQFTVYRPGKIKPEKWYPLLAYAHLGEPRSVEDAFDPIAHMEEDVEKTMAAQDVKDYRRASEDSFIAIPRQGEISFVPFIEGVEFNPPGSSFFWRESLHRQEFRMRASSQLDGRTARGQMSVFLGTILLAEINLSIQVTSIDADIHQVRPQREKPARPYRKIFPSYSHKDREIVAQIEHFAQITGDRYMRDVNELRSGQNWKEWMAETIAEADIFQLFWSTNSMRSENVRLEWEYALGLKRSHFIRPTYWETPLPQSRTENLPPPELKDLHFQHVRPLASPSLKETIVKSPKSRSTQHKLARVRPPRVHISYDVPIGGAIEMKEIPFVVAVLGDLSGSQPLPKLRQRKFVEVDRDNFDDILAKTKPRLSFIVDDLLTGEGNQLAVELDFRHLSDFEPEQVITKVEPLRNLLRVREQLADEPTKVSENGLGIADIDRLLSQQLDCIIHAPEFQELEACWRGLHYLVSQTNTGSMLKIWVLDVSKKELLRDFERAPEFDQTALFKKVYEDNFGFYGGTPIGTLIGNYEFGSQSHDIALLRAISGIAALSHTPFIAAASPQIFDCDNFAELSDFRDITKLFDRPEYNEWTLFRELEDSRYVGLVIPRILLRSPYSLQPVPMTTYHYEENVKDDARSFLLGNAAYAFGVCLANAFEKHNWCAVRGVEGGGLVQGLPTHVFKTDEDEQALECPTDIALTDRLEGQLSDIGFIPLVWCKNTDYAAFFNTPSTHKVKSNDHDVANARLSSQLGYVITASRFAHYIKVMMIDSLGSMTRTNCERFLNQWISQYVRADDVVTPNEEAHFPLREARIEVSEVKGKLEAVMYLRPRFQLDGLSEPLRLVVELPSPARSRSSKV